MHVPPHPPRENPADLREHEGALAYPDRSSSPARVTARHRDARARTARAAATWAAGWGMAVAAVFLPVLHFILVPLLLVAAPALAWQRLHEAATLVRAEGDCPACAAPQRFTLGGPWRPRTAMRCEGCGRRIELVLPDTPPAA